MFRRIAARLGLAAMSLGILVASTGCAALGLNSSPRAEFRGANIGIGTLESREEIDEAMAKAERAGVNALFVNVWYHGPMYRSPQFQRREGAPEDFDPVRYMIDECNERDIAFYAMFVNGRSVPSNPWHREEYLILDSDLEQDTTGQRRNYTIPEVREHEIEMMTEFVRLFPDATGIQFDYIRFPWQRDFPYNPETREMYQEVSGIDPLELENNPDRWSDEEHERLFAEWREWRTNLITDLVREVSERVREIDPDMQICASVLARPNWIATACQDWPRWVNEGIVDFAKPMYYQSDNEGYREKLDWYRSLGVDEQYWDRIIPSVSGRVRESSTPERAAAPRVGGDQAYVPGEGTVIPDDDTLRAQLVADKAGLMREVGLHGVNYFTLNSMSEETLQILRDTYWKDPVTRYVPPPRNVN